MAYADGAAIYKSGFKAGMTPDPELWVDKWAEEHAYIPAEGNAEGGKYDIERTPFARGVLEALSPDYPATRVVVMGASQLLKTQCAMIWMMASVDQAAANILALMPSDNLAGRLAGRISSTYKATPRVADKFAKPGSGDGKNTESVKTYRGGTIFIATAGSAANLAEVPARYGYGDEIDDWEVNLQGQGDPIRIFENRGSTYGRRRKWYYSSSPKKPKEVSRIHRLFMMGDQRYFNVPCPDCGHYHVLLWENLVLDSSMTKAVMVCPQCGFEIEEHHKTTMLARGIWIATAAGQDGTVSFTISQLYAPVGWVSWLELATMHMDADLLARRGDSTELQAFYNTRLALCYDNTKAITTVEALKKRAESYTPRVIPHDAWVLTADADVQKTRIEVQIEAWGPRLEHWLIDYIVIPGSPSVDPTVKDCVWQKLDEIYNTEFLHESGAKLRISAFGIDSGFATQDVYNYASPRQQFGFVIHKGATRPNKPIIAAMPTLQDITWHGDKIEGGAELWEIGTDVAKDWIFDRLELKEGPGAFHFHDQLPVVWFEQLLAERKIKRHIRGQVIEVWHKEQHVRNEALDVTVGNVALAYKLGLHKFSLLDWAELQERITLPLLIKQETAEPRNVAADALVKRQGAPAVVADADDDGSWHIYSSGI